VPKRDMNSPLFGLKNRLISNEPRPGSPVTSGMRALRGLITQCQRASTQAIKNSPGLFPNGKRPTIIGPKRKRK
jgi:hypothetical protein